MAPITSAQPRHSFYVARCNYERRPVKTVLVALAFTALVFVLTALAGFVLGATFATLPVVGGVLFFANEFNSFAARYIILCGGITAFMFVLTCVIAIMTDFRSFVAHAVGTRHFD